MADAEPGVQYVEAFYWSVATLATVGYGDTVPVNAYEKVFATVAMLLGGGYFGYIIALMAALVSKLDASTTKYNEKVRCHALGTQVNRASICPLLMGSFFAQN